MESSSNWLFVLKKANFAKFQQPHTLPPRSVGAPDLLPCYQLLWDIFYGMNRNSGNGYVQGGEAPKVPSAEYLSTGVLWDISFRRNSGNGKDDVFKGVRRPKCQALAKVKPSSACPTNFNNRSLCRNCM